MIIIRKKKKHGTQTTFGVLSFFVGFQNRKVKTLGDDDEDDDAHAWIEKSRKLQQEKEKAEKKVGFVIE